MTTLLSNLGVAREDLEKQRAALIEFAEQMYAPLRRCDQRAKAQCYTRGLMIEGRRKSMQPMAERIGEVDDQGLQQFISDSPWDETAVRRRLARRMCGELEPLAWAIDDTGVPKSGRLSPGVARQYCGELGKVANCQVGVSVNAVCDQASCPLDWRLFLPAEWDEDGQRRARAKIPEKVRHRPKWQLALDMLDELKGWGLAPAVVVADAGYGEICEFRAGLEQRELAYVVQVKGATSVHPADAEPVRPAYQGRGRPPVARYPTKPSSLRGLALSAGREAAVTVCWREGSRGTLRSEFIALRVRPAGGRHRNAGGERPERWLLAEWPADAAEPVKYWLSNLPADTPIERLVGLGKLRWRIEHDYRELKQCLGLGHYEGRSWRGWHHHVTCVSVAHAFLTRWRLSDHADPDQPQPDEPRPAAVEDPPSAVPRHQRPRAGPPARAAA
ncbi:MAG TPA: IS701 family transposase [Gaiellales bacterium]|nr:IS701 family transposase [Gaiellales bacterium]